MKTPTLKTLALGLALAGLAAVPAHAVSIIWNPDVDADWSSTDSLQGYDVSYPFSTGFAIYAGSGPDGLNDQVVYHPLSRFTDATSSVAPTLGAYGGDVLIDWTFDLTSYPGAPAVSLSSFSMWAARDTTFRPYLNVQMQISLDGLSWTTVASTVQTAGGPTTAGYDNIVFNFAEGEASNFRYLQIVDTPGGPYSKNPTWIE